MDREKRVPNGFGGYSTSIELLDFRNSLKKREREQNAQIREKLKITNEALNKF